MHEIRGWQRRKIILLSVWFVCWVTGSLTTAKAAAAKTYDVVVYTGTAGGAIAAIAAAKQGAKTALLEPGRHIGGMVSGGLGHTDVGNRDVIGGMALEFYERVAKHYGKSAWDYRGPEPHVAENVLKDWLKEAGVDVYYGHRLSDVVKQGRRIVSISTQNGDSFEAAVFVDAGYEGDLMARAKVSYAVGRESRDLYDESWAGRQPVWPGGHQFPVAVSPFVDGINGELLPLIHPKPMVEAGEGDGAVQGYGFRLCVTRRKDNLVPFPKPDKYDPKQFELLRRYLEKAGKNLQANRLLSLRDDLPNAKADVNSTGAISLNLLDGSNWEYPDADYPKRQEIWDRHLEYSKGFLYFLSHDPSVPPHIQDEINQWGLCKDEFADTEHFPHQLYIRDGRRMIGEYVTTQEDLQGRRTKYDSIGMGSYNMDIRATQRVWAWVSRFPNLVGETFNEGYLSIPVEPYQIAYRSLTPRYEECENLLVPVCMSASAVAFSSIRMEPQYMLLGHAAGVAAALSSKGKVAVQRLSIEDLQRNLRQQGQLLEFESK